MKVMVIKIETYHYLNKIKPNLKNIVINLQNSDTWKNQLTHVNNVACNALKE